MGVSLVIIANKMPRINPFLDQIYCIKRLFHLEYFYHNFYTANDTTRVLIKSIQLKKKQSWRFQTKHSFLKNNSKMGSMNYLTSYSQFFCSFPTTLYALMSFHSFPYFKHVNQTFFLCNFLYNELYMFIILCALNFFLKRIHNEESIMSNNQ